MFKRFSTRLFGLFSAALLGTVFVLPTGVAHADDKGYYRGTYCNPGGNDPCMSVYLSPDHSTVTLTWSSNRHNKYQIWSDPPLDRHGNHQVELGGDVNTVRLPLLQENAIYNIQMQSCDYDLVSGTTCYGWTNPPAKLWTGPHEVYGAILDKYQEFGAQYGDGLPWHPVLGYPNGDDAPTGSRTGAFNFFQGGEIFWSAKTGAHEVHGFILNEWDREGREYGKIGYPTSDELYLSSGGQRIGRVSLFECGRIEFRFADGSIRPLVKKGCVTQVGYHN